ncbi:MAG: sulfurtransferase TusA family protein [Okeania sp. SIO1H5]|uniref:sulfurtransferase TusA family protein n=1 Tax=Okeania sp. SIO1H5 TaxID=2607777 RepID=UPI0013BB8756|nr:sulfurtransferase TusA family protein [Okeania sp. SIO1H5]NET23781.1 sulfurtransferase TusA family protein [Okeania sp. SIO1H5]
MSDRSPDFLLNLSGVQCPLNYAKCSVRLAKMKRGEWLYVILDGGSPVQNVPRGLKGDGHKIISLLRTQGQPEQFAMVVEKC